MSRVRNFRWIVGSWLVLMIAGCGSDSFLPPPPAELAAVRDTAVRDSAAPATVRVVDLILDGPETDDRVTLVQMALRNAGLSKVSLRSTVLKKAGSEKWQVDLIRDAVARSTNALIIEAVDAPAVIKELEAARKQGVKVVIFDRSLATGESGKPFPRVTFASFAPVAKEMVQAAAHEAEVMKIPPKGPAIILVNEQTDNHTADRIEAIKSALKEAGIPVLETLKFKGDMASGEAVLKPRIDGPTPVSYVFAEDDRGLSAAYAVRLSQGEKKATFLMSGFVSYDLRLRKEAVQVCASVVDRNLEGLARKAVDLAVSMMNGKTVPDETRVPMTSHAAKPAIGPPPGVMPPTAPGSAGPPVAK